MSASSSSSSVRFGLFTAIVAAGALGACSRGGGVVDVVVAGSSTIQPVMDIAGPRYEKLHPGVRVQVQGGGSSVGITSPRQGLAQIGMVSRGLKPDESDLMPVKIGDDGIALIAHKDNPITALKRDDVVKIYTGAVTSWKDVGGADAPITVINKEEGRSTLELFEKHFELKDKIIKSAVIIGPNGQAISTVAGNPNALAYVSIGSAEIAVKQGAAIKLLSLDGVDATTANVKNATYPLRRELNLVTKGAPAGEVKGLIDFVLGKDGQAILVDQGFVPVTDPAAAGH